MADVSDVEQALVGLIAAALYPNGTGQAAAVGAGCRVYRGWPTAKALETDLRAGLVNINVFPTNVVRNTTRYANDWQDLTFTTATLSVGVASNTVTVSGTITAGLNVAIIVDGFGASYTVQGTDTLTSIATALAALISAKRTATSSGAVVTIPGAAHLVARVGTFGTQIREVARQFRDFQVNIWCQTPTLRDSVGQVLAPMLAGTERLSMPDGSAARMLLVNDGNIEDGQQKEQVYRRYITYSVEYATTQVQNATQVVVETLTASGGLTTPQSVVTVSQ